MKNKTVAILSDSSDIKKQKIIQQLYIHVADLEEMDQLLMKYKQSQQTQHS